MSIKTLAELFFFLIIQEAVADKNRMTKWIIIMTPSIKKKHPLTHKTTNIQTYMHICIKSRFKMLLKALLTAKVERRDRWNSINRCHCVAQWKGHSKRSLSLGTCDRERAGYCVASAQMGPMITWQLRARARSSKMVMGHPVPDLVMLLCLWQPVMWMTGSWGAGNCIETMHRKSLAFAC